VPSPRLRIFAGPNGSGKSTLNSILDKKLLGYYINADDIEKNIHLQGFLDFSPFLADVNKEDFFSFLSNHPLILKAELDNEIKKLYLSDNKLYFPMITLNSYYTSVCADYIRHKLLEQKVDFTFETVMSSPDKVDFMRLAKESGYRVYLYYIATQDPIINIDRVSNRVKKGGHSVPKEKIEERYYRSLGLLKKAVSYTDRAYIFDNSSSDTQKVWLAEITNAEEIEFHTDEIPSWLNDYLIKP
jgi:predicted ABC-type ATPase